MLTFRCFSQVDPKDVGDVFDIVLLEKLNDSNVYILDYKPKHESVKSVNRRFINERKGIGFCVKKQLLMINNQAIEDNTYSFWKEYSVGDYSFVSLGDLDSIYLENNSLTSHKEVIIIVSPVFSRNNKKCLINVSFKQKEDKGENVLYFLKRKKEGWLVKREYVLLSS